MAEIEFLKRYDWKDHVNDIYPRYYKDGTSIIPNDARKCFFSRLNDDVVFFKTEADMIAFDNHDSPTLKYDHIKQRGKYLASVIG